jgi:CRISPR/Cas system-associated endonuclease Cas1
LRNYNRRAEDPFIEKVRSDIRILADKLHMAHSVEEVMGYEGMMARNLFSGDRAYPS